MEKIRKLEKLYNESNYSLSSEEDNGEGRVLIIYTGGTIGSMPRDRDDKSSPQEVVDWEEFFKNSPLLSKDSIGFCIDAYSTKPLDSCNLGPNEWVEMATVIQKSYENYEGFVILHGTDTLVYTASVLSFMLQNLGKPVVITGAQMTYLFNVRNDGWQNLISALMVANPKFSNIPTIPEVCVYFGGRIMRGNRCRKINATGFNAYDSPNFKPLALLGDYIEIDEDLLIEPAKQTLRARLNLNTNVVALTFFPGLQNSPMLENILRDESLKGIVLLSYGSGNIPTDDHVLKMINEAHKRKVVLLNVTQTGGGRVELGMYDTSAKLIDVGVISGVDITPESALVKLMVLLGDEDLSFEELEYNAQIDLAGEQSISIYTTKFKKSEAQSLHKERNRIRIPASNIQGHSAIRNQKVDRIMIRLLNGKLKRIDKKAKIQVYADLNSGEELNKRNLLGELIRQTDQVDPSVIIFDITKGAKEKLLERTSLTLVIDESVANLEWTDIELVIYEYK